MENLYNLLCEARDTLLPDDNTAPDISKAANLVMDAIDLLYSTNQQKD